MNFLSAAKISESWGCSPRRVTQLCELGRIEGAVKTGKSWRIPENAPKPADTRTRAARKETGKVSFIYPYILAAVHSREQLDSFSPEERELYRADCLLEECRYEECLPVVKRLLRTTENPYIRLGALYLMPFLYFYLFDMESAVKYSVMFKNACYACEEHRTEVNMLLASFNLEFCDTRDISAKYQLGTFSDYSEEMLPLISLVNAMDDLEKCADGVSLPNTASHELICTLIEREGYFYYSMLLHCYISLMYSFLHDEANERLHLRRAVDIAVRYRLYSVCAEILFALPASIMEILKEYPEEVAERFLAGARRFYDARAALLQHRGTNSILFELKQQDYLLISYCIKEYSVEKMAALFGLSVSGMKKRLSALYERFGVKTKNELSALYLNAVRSLGAEEGTET